MSDDDYRSEPMTYTPHVRVEHLESGWQFCAECHNDWPCSYAMSAAEAEIARLRVLVGAHDPTGADHMEEMMVHAQRADAAEAEIARLREVMYQAECDVQDVRDFHGEACLMCNGPDDPCGIHMAEVKVSNRLFEGRHTSLLAKGGEKGEHTHG